MAEPDFWIHAKPDASTFKKKQFDDIQQIIVFCYTMKRSLFYLDRKSMIVYHAIGHCEDKKEVTKDYKPRISHDTLCPIISDMIGQVLKANFNKPSTPISQL